MNFIFFQEISKESNIKRSIFIFYCICLQKHFEIFLIICKSFGKYLHFRLYGGFWCFGLSYIYLVFLFHIALDSLMKIENGLVFFK